MKDLKMVDHFHLNSSDVFYIHFIIEGKTELHRVKCYEVQVGRARISKHRYVIIFTPEECLEFDLNKVSLLKLEL